MKQGTKLKRSVRVREALEARLRKALAFRRRRTKKIGRAEGRSPRWHRSRDLLGTVFANTVRAHRKAVVARKRLVNFREKLRKPKGAKAAIKWALDQRGTTEQPYGSNSGPKISDWIRAGGGRPGWAWCQYFANVVATKGGAPQLKTGYTVYVLQGTIGKDQGYRRVSTSDVKPGDFVYFKFPYAGAGGDEADHVGVYVGNGMTIEGNTSPGSAGSQSNGGGVFVRLRPKSQWAGVVRPPYKN